MGCDASALACPHSSSPGKPTVESQPFAYTFEEGNMANAVRFTLPGFLQTRFPQGSNTPRTGDAWTAAHSAQSRSATHRLASSASPARCRSLNSVPAGRAPRRGHPSTLHPAGILSSAALALASLSVVRPSASGSLGTNLSVRARPSPLAWSVLSDTPARCRAPSCLLENAARTAFPAFIGCPRFALT